MTTTTSEETFFTCDGCGKQGKGQAIAAWHAYPPDWFSGLFDQDGDGEWLACSPACVEKLQARANETARSRRQLQLTGLLPLGVGQTWDQTWNDIGPGQDLVLSGMPQTLFRPTHLIVESNAPQELIVSQFTIGSRTFAVSPGALPADAFQIVRTCAPGYMQVTLPTAHVAERLTVSLMNKGEHQRRVMAFFVGTYVLSARQ